jgi:hypothetical protein
MSYDPMDAEQQPAADFGVTVDGETSWFLADQQQAINIRQRADGVWLAALEDFSGGLDDA